MKNPLGFLIVAETFVEGDTDEASGKGFRAIADYIFGNNVAVGAAPQALQGARRWRVHFVMPSADTLKTLPMFRRNEIMLEIQ